MRGHDGSHARVDGSTEGHELPRLERRAVDPNRGQLDVRIQPGVAVSREVLRRRRRARLLTPTHEGGGHGGDHGRVAAERTHAYDRICGLTRDVSHRREDEVDARRKRLVCGGPPLSERQVGDAGGADGHLRREDGAAVELLAEAALQIGCDQ